MTDEHAMIERDGYRVPLIGIDPAAVLEECDGCHNEFGLRELQLQFTGQLLCRRCHQRIESPVSHVVNP